MGTGTHAHRAREIGAENVPSESQGLDNVLGDFAELLLDQTSPSAVGVIVDANDKGVASRTARCRSGFGDRFANAMNVEPGCVKSDSRNVRFGLWVAPNNQDPGSLTALMMRAIEESRQPLLEVGSRFVTELEVLAPDKLMKDREKAQLGAIHQCVASGGSLASGIARSHCWLEESLRDQTPFKELIDFLEELAGLSQQGR